MTEKMDIIHNQKECNAKLSAVGDALYVIGGKWKLRVIIALSEGHSRFNDLQRAIPGISAKVLSNELKELELNGFVRRQVYNQVPVVVEYQITPYSTTLEKVVQALSEWGAMHRRMVLSGNSVSVKSQESPEGQSI